jgi:hypothetical protein
MDEPGLWIAHLKRVGIYQGHQCGIGDEDVGLVDIAYDVTAGVQGSHGGGEVAGCAVQVRVIEQRAQSAAGLGVIVVHDGARPARAGHQETDEAAIAVVGVK